MAKYVSSLEIREFLGCTRQYIHILAQRENWRIKDFNRPHYYLETDVQAYFLNRNHTQRAKTEFNKKIRGMIRHDENGYSKNCPVCRWEAE